MSNQDQFSQAAQDQQSIQQPEFSTTRRVVTVCLVLVAAGLFGYLLYMALFSKPVNIVEVEQPATPEVSGSDYTGEERLEIMQELSSAPTREGVYDPETDTMIITEVPKTDLSTEERLEIMSGLTTYEPAEQDEI
jgi:hypothetical protein